MVKMNAKQLRDFRLHIADRRFKDFKEKMPKNEIYVVLDNVLDTYNIGSVFRLCDAVAIKKLFLCGGTATPPNPRIMKASINTTEWVDWEYHESTLKLIHELKVQNPKLKIVGIEQDQGSVPYDKYEYQLPIALVVGNETTGISPEVLNMCDDIVELPMFGVNISLNVMVSLGIVLYQVISKTH